MLSLLSLLFVSFLFSQSPFASLTLSSYSSFNPSRPVVLRLEICLVAENSIVPAVILLQSKLRNVLDILEAVPDQNSVMTTMVELRWYEALVLYKYHFFG